MDELKKMLLAEGASEVAWADLQSLPAECRAGLPRGVCILVALDAAIVSGIESGPTEQYCAEYGRVNALLNRLASAAATSLQQRSFKAITPASAGIVVDPATLSTILPHKTVATRAGLGWIGKCALLVTERFGSAFRMSTVLTDAELPVGAPVTSSRCGICRDCVDACPGSAVTGKEWRPGMSRDELFDAFACRDASRALAKKANISSKICGKCIAVCPFTKAHIRQERGCKPLSPLASRECGNAKQECRYKRKFTVRGAR